MQRLFVYGTLMPGRPNEHILAPLSGSWQPATVKGHLRLEGWGASMGFPALVPDEGGEAVKGLIFSSEQLGDFWETLDAFEGEQYERVLVQVSLEDGRQDEVYIYALKGC